MVDFNNFLFDKISIFYAKLAKVSLSKMYLIWRQEHWKYMQSLPEEFDILHYVSILDLEKI